MKINFPSNLSNWVLLRDFNNDGKKDIFSYVSGGIQFGKIQVILMIFHSLLYIFSIFD